MPIIRKSIEDLQAEAGSHGMRRALGLLHLVLFGIGCILGAGIYVLPGTAAANFAGVAPHSEWLIYLGLSTPRLSVRSFSAEPAGENLWRLRLVVENSGWLPTHGSQQALDQLVVGGVSVELKLPTGARLIEGASTQQLDQLVGRTEQRSTASWWGYTPGTPDRAFATWIVAAPAGTAFTARASHDRAGSVRAELVLGEMAK